jgi:predicted dehydrogenase
VNASPHGIAVIGLGTVGLRYVEQYQSSPDFDLVGGFDLSADACAAAEQRFDVAIADSALELVQDDRVAAVYVAVPPLYHREYVDMVVAAGKALLCEKPLGVDDADSVAMVQAVADSGTAGAVNYVFGAAPSAQALLAAVETSGETILGVDLRVHFEQWPRAWQAGATWLRDRDQGGWTREVISHYIFLILRLLGTPTIESCHAEFPADGTSEQKLTATLRADGVPITIVGSSDAAGLDEVEFTVRSASTGWRLTNWYQFTSCATGEPWVEALSAEESSGPTAYRAQLSQLGNLITGQPQTLATFDEALLVQRIVEEMLDAADPKAK